MHLCAEFRTNLFTSVGGRFGWAEFDAGVSGRDDQLARNWLQTRAFVCLQDWSWSQQIVDGLLSALAEPAAYRMLAVVAAAATDPPAGHMSR